MDNLSDFGERTWAENLQDESTTASKQIVELANYDQRLEEARNHRWYVC